MKIAIITNIIPTYREHFYDIIFNNSLYDVQVFCQSHIAGTNIKSSHEKYNEKIYILKSYSPFKSERLVWQFLPVVKLFKDFDILVVDGNLRHLSQAILSTIFKLFGKKIVVWSNVYTFGGNKDKQKIRLAWWKMFDNFLMYTEKDATILREIGFENKNILSINNGLNQNAIDKHKQIWNQKMLLDFKIKHQIASENIIISSGRFNEVNNHIIALKAIEIVKKTFPDILWIVIGDGSEKDEIEKKIKDSGLTDNVRLLGEVYDEEKKCPWFLISEFFLHPGPIGLSIFNAYGYSLPVITHENQSNHGPEFFLFEENKTGFLFKENDENDLARKIIFALKNKETLEYMTTYTYNIARNKNNTDIMSKQFFKMMQSLQQL